MAERSWPLKMKDRGIDESKCGELSKAFVRMDSRYGGIGLGLSIVSHITQLHHGQFFLQNRQEDFRHAGLGTAEERSVRGKPDIKKLLTTSTLNTVVKLS